MILIIQTVSSSIPWRRRSTVNSAGKWSASGMFSRWLVILLGLCTKDPGWVISMNALKSIANSSLETVLKSSMDVSPRDSFTSEVWCLLYLSSYSEKRNFYEMCKKTFYWWWHVSWFRSISGWYDSLMLFYLNKNYDKKILLFILGSRGWPKEVYKYLSKPYPYL